METEQFISQVESMPRQRVFPVVETFGPTIQGEGRLAGVPCYFIRFGGCDYRCAWCDSLHAVLPEAVARVPLMTATTLLERFQNVPGDARWVIISGGNPALHDLEHVVLQLRQMGFNLQMETQGTVYRDWMKHVNIITVSPKGPSAQLSPSQRRNQMRRVTDFLEKRRLSGTTAVDLKVPIFDEADLEFAKTYVENFPKIRMFLSVGNDQGVDTSETLLRKYQWLIETTLATPGFTDVRILPQLHVLVWGNDRGR